MNERNPYESDDTVDIPDFSSIKVNDDDIDRSVFKMNDDTTTTSYEEIEEDDDEEYEDDDEVSYRKVKKSGIVMMAAIMVILLILSIFGVVWGISKNKAYSTLKSEYDAYVSKASATESELNNKITELQNQINNSGSNSGSTDGSGTSTETVTYKVSSAVDTINVRSQATSSSDRVKYDSLSSAVQSAVHKNDEGYAYVETNGTFTVYETATDSDGNTWARIDTNAWVCVVNGGTTWASKQ